MTSLNGSPTSQENVSGVGLSTQPSCSMMRPSVMQGSVKGVTPTLLAVQMGVLLYMLPAAQGCERHTCFHISKKVYFSHWWAACGRRACGRWVNKTVHLVYLFSSALKQLALIVKVGLLMQLWSWPLYEIPGLLTSTSQHTCAVHSRQHMVLQNVLQLR